MSGKHVQDQVATGIAILFHCVGLIGLLFFDRAFFLAATPGNLLLMIVLLVWTQKKKNGAFVLFLIGCLIIGFIVEMIGVRSSLLFGHYFYGGMMGFRVLDTPLVVGINWFIVIYCSGSCIYLLGEKRSSAGWIIGAGALLATLYDWLMEPAACRLGYWQWIGDGNPPLYNYLCWFLTSVVLLAIFRFATFEKPNRFAQNLMLIQVLFFLVLRIALK